MIRPIAISLSPNTEKDDVVLALKTFFTPWKWIKEEYIGRTEKWFSRYFNAPFVFSFDSGRSAQYAILKSLGINKGDEILIQAFTCVAVPNSISWVGAKPIYVDIDIKTFNMDLEDLERKITKNSKAIIVQHTFGIASEIDKIKKLAKEYELVLIEDCAHALGAQYKGKKIGTFSDAAFFSFGRDKIVSSVFGGMVITKNKEIAKHLKQFQKNLPSHSLFWVMQQLVHPISFAIILPLYNVFNIGKILLFFLQKLNVLSLPVSKEEKHGHKPALYPRKFANGLAILAYNQLKKLDRLNNHRKEMANIYMMQLKDFPFKLPIVKDGDIFLRFPIILQNNLRQKDMLRAFKKNKILIGDWYSNVIDPAGVDFKKVGYIVGSCPNAEYAARHVINLPTYPSIKTNDIKKVIRVMASYVENKKNRG